MFPLPGLEGLELVPLFVPFPELLLGLFWFDPGLFGLFPPALLELLEFELLGAFPFPGAEPGFGRFPGIPGELFSPFVPFPLLGIAFPF